MAEYEDIVPATVSNACTRRYHVPSVRPVTPPQMVVESVHDREVVVDVVTPEPKALSCDHCTW